MKKQLVYIILCLMIGLCGCNKQSRCYHEWNIIGLDIGFNENNSGIIYDIYCPKCELEQNVSYKEWNKLQLEMQNKK